MGFRDDKVVVDVKDIDDGELLYIDGEGTEHTYYPATSTSLEVATLEVVTGLRQPRKDGGEPTLVTKLRGTAALADHSISVIGDPASQVRFIEVIFEAGDWQPKPPEATEQDIPMHPGNLGGAMLGFNRSDWEVGNDDQWYCSCFLSEKFIDRLAADVHNSRLQAMRLSLSLRSLYTTVNTYAPAGVRGHLFLRPSRRDNAIGLPALAQGHVWSIQYTSTHRNLRFSKAVQSTSDTEQVPEELPREDDSVAVAIASLGAKIDGLRSTLEWVGGFIVVAVLLAALSGCSYAPPAQHPEPGSSVGGTGDLTYRPEELGSGKHLLAVTAVPGLMETESLIAQRIHVFATKQAAASCPKAFDFVDDPNFDQGTVTGATASAIVFLVDEFS